MGEHLLRFLLEAALADYCCCRWNSYFISRLFDLMLWHELKILSSPSKSLNYVSKIQRFWFRKNVEAIIKGIFLMELVLLFSHSTPAFFGTSWWEIFIPKSLRNARTLSLIWAIKPFSEYFMYIKNRCKVSSHRIFSCVIKTTRLLYMIRYITN